MSMGAAYRTNRMILRQCRTIDRVSMGAAGRSNRMILCERRALRGMPVYRTRVHDDVVLR